MRRIFRAVGSYFLAAVLAGMAVGLRWLAIPLFGTSTPYLLVFATAATVALLLGLGPGMVAALTAVAGTEWWATGWQVSGVSVARVAVVILSTFFFGMVGHLLRKTQRALAESEARFRIALEHSPVTVFTTDRTFRFSWVYHPGAFFDHCLVGKRVTECYPLEDVAALVALERQVLQRETRAQQVLEIVIEGQQRWFDITVEPMRDPSGRVVGLIGASLDVTAIKRSEGLQRKQAEALRNANQQKNDFMALLAHELRNPLAPIRNAAHLLKMAAADAEEVRRQSATIERQVSLMARILDDLLDVSRITRGKLSLVMTPVAVRDILSRAAEIVAPLVKARRQTLHCDLPFEASKVKGDPDRLVQVASNLLTNASKYTDEGGQIWLSATEINAQVVMRVRDNGMGIEPSMLDRIFDPFTQAVRDPEKKMEGLGIGLALVRNLTEMHGGSVEVRSEGPGKGSEFVVRLPAQREQEEG